MYVYRFLNPKIVYLFVCFSFYILLAPSDCGKPTPLEDGDIEGTVGHRYRHGDRVKYTCPNYYKMQGDPHKTCTNGEWIGQMRCLSKLQFHLHFFIL